MKLKATEQFFSVVLLVLYCKVFLSIRLVDKIQMKMKANDRHFPVSGTVYHAVQGASKF